jgi:hypothetical protein
MNGSVCTTDTLLAQDPKTRNLGMRGIPCLSSEEKERPPKAINQDLFAKMESFIRSAAASPL